MALKLYIKQNSIFGVSLYPGQEIHYEGLNPQTLNTVAGPLPAGSNRRWPSYGTFIDATTYVSDINVLKLEWSANRDDIGNVAADQVKPVKGVSGTITFERTGYDLLKAWLVDDVSANLNSVEVKIQDTDCDSYTGYVIKSNDITWCESGLCTYDVNLKQQDELLSCIKRTFITDNWQGWFQKVPAGGKKHPRFSYCNEVRPNGTMIMEWYVMTSIISIGVLIFLTLAPIINSVIAGINLVIGTINLIISFINALGASITPLNYINFLSLDGLFDGLSTIYIESSGCGREHPAPLIRDYITNVCDKCGIIVTKDSAPILFNPVITVETSGRGEVQQSNPHYWATYFSAPVRRGLRRFRRMSIFSGFQDPNNEYWIPDNDPFLYLDLFLDKIKGLYNADWRLMGGILYFQRKDWFQNAQPLYDFTANSPDRNKIIEGICWTAKDSKYPASVNGIYSPDSDSCGNEAGNIHGTGQMNGVYDFGNKDNNPNLNGILDKSLQFGATKFRFDGASSDYIYDALQVVMNGAGFSANPLPGATFTILQQVAEKLAPYADYALLMSDETCTLPKVLIWDQQSYENAKVIRTKAAWDGVAAQPMPDINGVYNGIVPFAPQQWKQRHYPQTDVLGKSLTFAASPNGIYRVTDTLGIIITERPALLPNYPMYFEPYYLDTLWDWFHWIDDPIRNPKLNRDWRLKIRYCCKDAQDILKITGDASQIQLLQKVTLDAGFFQHGRLKNIAVNFDPTDEYGQYIELSGDI